MTGETHRDAPPPFERSAGGAETVERVYDAVLHAREPMPVSEIAALADCADESARTHLSFLTDLRIVTQHEGQPVRYQRNSDYFEWRRVHNLVEAHTDDELQACVSELTDRIEAYRDKYNAEIPADVNVLDFDAAEIDDVYVDLGDWASAIEERRLHERARRTLTESTTPAHE